MIVLFISISLTALIVQMKKEGLIINITLKFLSHFVCNSKNGCKCTNFLSHHSQEIPSNLEFRIILNIFAA